MPGSMPATSQLDWLISMTAMIVLFWSRATRDLLRACPGAGRGRSAGALRHSIGYMQRRSCHFLAGRPIESHGPTPNGTEMGGRRRPVVLAPEAWPAWLGEEPADEAHLKSLLAPYPSDGMMCWPVSPRVGSVKNNDPSLVEPIDCRDRAAMRIA